jgi:hypothetical protein
LQLNVSSTLSVSFALHHGHCVYFFADVGTLEDGSEFESEEDFRFILGHGNVLKGWDVGTGWAYVFLI